MALAFEKPIQPIIVTRRSENNLGMKLPIASDDGCGLVLVLVTPRAYDYGNNMGLSAKKDLPNLLLQCIPSECDSILQLGFSCGNIESSSVLDYSGSTETDVNMSCFSSQSSAENNYLMITVVDEGSTSAKKSGGYMPSLFFGSKNGQ